MNNTPSSLLEQLRTDGISATLDNDGDISFTQYGLSYLLCLDPDDTHFSGLMLPRVWQVTSGEQVSQVMAVINDINSRLKLVKGIMDKGQVSFIVELWLPDPLAWRDCLARARDTLVHAVHLFVDAMENEPEGLQFPARKNTHQV